MMAARLKEVAGVEQRVGLEEPLHAFPLGVERGPEFPALVRVAQQPVDGRPQWVLDAGAFELGHAQRNAVHEQQRIRDDVAAPAGQFQLELVDDEEIVVDRILEINQPHRLIAPEVPIRQAVNLRALEQKSRRRFVHPHQTMTLGLLQLFGDAADAVIIQPRLAVFARIEFAKCGGKPALEQHLAEVLPPGKIGRVRGALDSLPAHRPERFAERALDQIVFPLLFAHEL